jgi:hypothetical protein
LQTFLPYSDFEKSVKCLDWKRLNKQRVEAHQIYNIITGKAKLNRKGKIAWACHPAVLMWHGFPEVLGLYYNLCIREWKERGHKNNMLIIGDLPTLIKNPEWLGDERLHSSHRQTLLFKKYEWYRQFGWEESPIYEYFWPSKCQDYIRTKSNTIL